MANIKFYSGIDVPSIVCSGDLQVDGNTTEKQIKCTSVSASAAVSGSNIFIKDKNGKLEFRNNDNDWTAGNYALVAQFETLGSGIENQRLLTFTVKNSYVSSVNLFIQKIS